MRILCGKNRRRESVLPPISIALPPPSLCAVIRVWVSSRLDVEDGSREVRPEGRV